jgi:hypothetical protein
MKIRRADNERRKLAERGLRDEIANFRGADRLSREEVHDRAEDMTRGRKVEGARIVDRFQ